MMTKNLSVSSVRGRNWKLLNVFSLLIITLFCMCLPSVIAISYHSELRLYDDFDNSTVDQPPSFLRWNDATSPNVDALIRLDGTSNSYCLVTERTGAGGGVTVTQNRTKTAPQNFTVDFMVNIPYAEAGDEQVVSVGASNSGYRLQFIGQGATIVFQVQDNSVTLCNHPTAITYDVWSNISLTRVYDNVKVYVDGALLCDNTTTNAHTNSAFYTRTEVYGDANSFIKIDNFTTTQILGTCSDGILNGDETAVDCGGAICSECPTETIDFRLFNTSIGNITSLYEFQPFLIKFNYSSDGNTSNTTAVCNFTSNNISALFFSKGLNKSLTGANQEQLLINEGNTSTLQDTILFRVCREGASGNDVMIYVNNSLYKTISKSLIPSCLGGFYEVRNVTKQFINQTGLNISVKCDMCSIPQSVRLINIKEHITDGFKIKFNRLFSRHSEQVDYNVTSGFREYNSYFYSFENLGTYVFNVSCNNNFINRTFSYVVSDTLPVSKLVQITDSNGTYVFNNNTNVESGDITILGSCSGENIILSNLSVKYSNNTFIKESTNTSIYLPSNLLGSDDLYKVNLTCTDKDNTNATISKVFNLTDGNDPNLVWLSPRPDGATDVVFNNSLSIDVTGTDLNLFSVQIKCYDNLSVKILDFYHENITEVAYQIINSTSVITNLGDGHCNFTVRDWHTENDIKNIDLKPTHSDNQLSFFYDKKELIINYTNIEVSAFFIDKLTDKYTFYPDTDIKAIPSNLRYTIECKSDILYYKLDQEYGHTFSCGRLWYDVFMDGYEDINDYDIKILSDNKASVVVAVGNVDNILSLKTKSVGVKNEVSEYKNFEVLSQPIDFYGDLTTSQVLMYGLLVLLWFGILVIGFWRGFPLAVVMAGFMGIFISFIVMNYSSVLGWLFLIVNAMFILLAFKLIE